jgi:hypothetical protein
MGSKSRKENIMDNEEAYVTNVFWHNDWCWGKLFVLYSDGTYDTYKLDNFMMELETTNLKLIFKYGKKNSKSISAKKYFNSRSMHGMTKDEVIDHVTNSENEWRDLMRIYEPWFVDGFCNEET